MAAAITNDGIVRQWHLLGAILADPRRRLIHAQVAWPMIQAYSPKYGHGRASVRYLEQATGLTKGSIATATADLVEWGYFTRQMGDGTRPTTYTPEFASVLGPPNAKPAAPSVLQSQDAEPETPSVLQPQDEGVLQPQDEGVLQPQDESFLLRRNAGRRKRKMGRGRATATHQAAAPDGARPVGAGPTRREGTATIVGFDYEDNPEIPGWRHMMVRLAYGDEEIERAITVEAPDDPAMIDVGSFLAAIGLPESCDDSEIVGRQIMLRETDQSWF